MDPGIGRDHYATLRVPRDASERQIKAAFRALSKRHHPDTSGAAAEMVRINRAYWVLSSPQRRAAYDRQLAEEERGRAAEPSSRGTPTPFRQARRPPDSNRIRGATFEVPLAISLREATHGLRREVLWWSYDSCPSCRGDGAAPSSPQLLCPRCGGDGMEPRTSKELAAEGVVSGVPCGHFKGHGWVPEQPCAECGGEGRVKRDRKREITIAQGAQDQPPRFSLPGWGDVGPRGGPPGDATIVVEVAWDERFERQRRDGVPTLDLVHDLELSMERAALGGEAGVPTLDAPVKIIVKLVRSRGSSAGSEVGDWPTVAGLAAISSSAPACAPPTPTT